MSALRFATTIILLLLQITVIKGEAIGIEGQIKSHNITDNLSITVYVPQSEHRKKLPTLYIMDGQYYLQTAIGIQKSLNHRNDITPNFIVVAIDTTLLPEPSSLRHQLLNNRANELKATLLNKIVPFVNANYPTSNMKIYFGWEHAAGFGLDLFNNSDFSGFLLASSPNYTNSRIEEFRKTLNTRDNSNRKLYLTLGHKENHAQNEHRMIAAIADTSPERGIQFKFNLTENYSHFTTAIDALVNGLIWHFSDYKEVNFYSIDEVINFGGVEGVIRFYKQRSANYQVPYQIPENTKFTMARHAVDNNDKKLLDEVIEKLGSFDTGGAYWGYFFAKFAFKHKDYGLAEQLIVSSTQVDSPSYKLLTLQGDIRVSQGQVKEARRLYAKALEATDSKDIKNIIQDKIDGLSAP